MFPHHRSAILVLTTVVVGLAVVAAPVAGAVPANAGPAQQSGQFGCDYASLYDQTIDSVVSVQTTAGLGSGFLYETDDGSQVVVTNAHVVGDASTVQVQFRDGEVRDGTVVGRDVLSDLAAVRVDNVPDYVEPLALNATAPDHGQPVAALGNPFGLEETITQGIVSGVNRSLPTQEGFRIPNTIQTDAAISSGNSGGPLVDCNGDVIGVNTAGIAAQGAENIGFSVSASIVERVVPDLVTDGEFAHPYVGVSLARVTPAVAEANGLDQSQGVYVFSVQNGTPAADVLQGHTGFERVEDQRVPVGGDVIVGADGREIRSVEELTSFLLTETEPGGEVTLTVVRDGERTNVTTTVIERPQPEPQ
jgi:S1-C subfamily serine protease